MNQCNGVFFKDPFHSSEEICAMDIINYRKETSSRGDEYWYGDLVTPMGLRKVFHRDDGPAIIIHYGTTSYHYKGMHHRQNGPALIVKDQSEEWFEYGRRSRLDEPAIIERNGDKQWFIDNQRHREDGPAIKNSNGQKSWYGKCFATEDAYLEACLKSFGCDIKGWIKKALN